MTTACHNQTYLRFRRWNRKSYSVFASLGRCVSVGVLDARICDAALQKTGIKKSICATPHIIIFEDNAVFLSDTSPKIENILPLFLSTEAVRTPCEAISSYLFLKKIRTATDVQKHGSRFFVSLNNNLYEKF